MDFDELTLGEIEEIENYAGCAFSGVGDQTPDGTKLRVALAWILKRRVDPNFTIQDARNLTTTQVSALFDELGTEKKA